MKPLRTLFEFEKNNTTFQREITAGLTAFFTVAYIIVVNSSILHDSGINLQMAVLATVFVSIFGCLLIGLYANAPIVLVPGMGINTYFTYTIVQNQGLSWQSALGIVVISGLIFMIIAFTSLGVKITQAIPSSLKHAISVGIGVLITFIGLQKGGVVLVHPQTGLQLGNLSDPQVILTLIGLLIALTLFILDLKAAFLLTILSITGLAAYIGITNVSASESLQISEYTSFFGSFSLKDIGKVDFWLAVFSLTLLSVFEHVGLLQGLLPNKDRFARSLKAGSVTAMVSGLFGTSPTISAAESAAGTAVGGRTGLTAITTGLAFALTLLFLPFINMIPNSATSPILVIVGALMFQSVKEIPFHNLSEAIPAFLLIIFIGFTQSIPDGMAFGFISYAIVRIVKKDFRKDNIVLFVIAGLFLISLFLK
ncbi:putative MFS transporter, AGZA family, xanthine/uracil permease [Thermoactinomyces sp. DSM 45891]|uniref:NCS2 family permease n=1 Tax=Thermoactinomyces sp. DSM 45891 TaxID=1761907 RepID=UPI000913DCDF|nr:NCS2 family permease [Thermoactinomyces sp. DSM 45891]SFX01824.1 putative MFS transporter, AGZA family, xanthine/uracil permease [Thermoactinomyces sp. DSM 45891]